MGRGPKYHVKGVRYAMCRGFKIQYVAGLKYHGYGVHYTIDRGFDIPWVGSQYTMGRIPMQYVLL
jgi:hypothetical protein